MKKDFLNIIKGRKLDSFLITDKTIVDNVRLLADSSSTNTLSLIGFYIAMQGLTTEKENMTQKQLLQRLGISNNLFYTCLKTLYNATLIDIEKQLVSYYKLIGSDDTIIQEDCTTVFSSITKDFFPIGSAKDILARKVRKNTSNLEIIQVVIRTNYLINDYPQWEKVTNVSNSRDWNDDLRYYLKSKK